MAKKFTTEHDFKHLTFDEAVDYLSENGTAEEKSAFKKACYTKADGEKVEKLNWLNGKRWFCENFIPELLPVKKQTSEPKANRIANW